MRNSSLNQDKLLGEVVGFVNENKPIYQATEEIKVRLINWDSILKKITEQDDDLKDKEWEIRSLKGVIMSKSGNAILIDDECCGLESEVKNFFIGGELRTIRIIEGVGVFKKKEKTDSGYTVSVFPSFYVDLDYEDLESCFTGEEVELWKFMGSRYEYNPRIHNNLRDIVKLYNGLPLSN